MGRVYLRDEVEQLLRDRLRRYEDEMQDPDNLSELIRLIVADADRARRLDDELVDALVDSDGGGSVWSGP